MLLFCRTINQLIFFVCSEEVPGASRDQTTMADLVRHFSFSLYTYLPCPVLYPNVFYSSYKIIPLELYKKIITFKKKKKSHFSSQSEPENKNRVHRAFSRFFDTSKQAIGALFIHFANVFLSTLTKEDPCSL